MNSFYPTKSFELHQDRVHLTLDLIAVGADLLVLLTGGRAHLGATAVADFAGSLREPWLCQLPGHREGELAELFARSLAQAYQCKVQATVGIHYDQITQAEINQVLQLAEELLKMACQAEVVSSFSRV